MMNQIGSHHVCLQDVLHIPHRSYVGFVANVLELFGLCICGNAIFAQNSTGCAAGLLISASPAKFKGHYECISTLLEDKVEQSEVYTACGGDSRLLHMDDYVNVSDTRDCFAIYNCCHAKVADGVTCGIFMPPYYWDQHDKTKYKYYCGVQWETVIEVNPQIKKLLENQYGTLENLSSIMPPCGCGAKFRPWSGGGRQIVEVCFNGRKPHAPHTERWYAFVADPLPHALQEEITRIHESGGNHDFITAWTQLSLHDAMDIIPAVYQCAGMQIDPLRLPGVARFPFALWKLHGEPYLDTAGWYALLQKVAEHDMENLQGIFDLCQRYREQHIEADHIIEAVV